MPFSTTARERKATMNPFKYGCTNAAQVFSTASVKKAVVKLERENIIYNYDGEYRFGNPFFCEWLLRR